VCPSVIWFLVCLYFDRVFIAKRKGTKEADRFHQWISFVFLKLSKTPSDSFHVAHTIKGRFDLGCDHHAISLAVRGDFLPST
jgi:hypothetical protein